MRRDTSRAIARRRRRAVQTRSLYRAAWPDMLTNLQAAYAELARAQFEIEQRAAEIDQTRDLFERVIDSMSEALFLMDHAGRVIRANRAACALLERAEAEIVGQPLAELCMTTAIPATPWQLLARAPGGTLPNLDLEIRLPGGRAIPLSLSCGLVRDKWGKITGVLVVARDITERKRAEETRAFLAEVGAQLATSLDYATTLDSVARLAVPYLADLCVVHTLEADGSIHQLAAAHTDPAAALLADGLLCCFFLNPDEPHGIPQVLRSGHAQLISEIAGAQLAGSARDTSQWAQLRAHGVRSFMAVPLLAHERTLGTISFIATASRRHYGPDDLALAEDLARRAALAMDNARLYREAQEALKIREAFLSIASHELKTPITSLLGHAELLKRRAAREGLLNPRDQRSLRVIYEQAERLNKMVFALLDLSRIQTGQLSIERKPLDLAALARRLVEETQPMLERHTLSIHTPDAPLMIVGDELRLEQVLQNLIQNAVKYSPAGGPIEVRVEPQVTHACIAVSDRGIGIPPEALPQLFHRFYRAANVDSQQISGLGIGLYVVKEIIALHGGEVEVTSREGQGSIFTICLPLPDREPQ